jgi:glycosyltransferase involved in cell wall biosynthesis
MQKDVAKRALGLSSSKKVILVGAENIGGFYKGFDHFIAAANRFQHDEAIVLLFGKSDAVRLSGITLRVRNLGYLRNELELSVAYSAADVFVAPSIQEAFGKTLVEAMACETPVVCFDCGGPKDIVRHKATGYRAAPFDSEDLFRGIQWVLEHKDPYGLRKANARRAMSKFDKKSVALRYRDLYKEILALSLSDRA